jgi:hypothetical protein
MSCPTSRDKNATGFAGKYEGLDELNERVRILQNHMFGGSRKKVKV